MIIKIGNFNFVSNNSEKIYLNEYNFKERFNYFYMNGKEDTLFVSNRDYFDNPRQIGDFEQKLLKKYYILDYHMLIRNRINDFIREKTTKLYMNNNYSRYDLYNDLKFDDIDNIEEETKSRFNYSEKITDEDKLIYDIENGNSLCFDPYSEKIENLEELYHKKLFKNQIKNSLILLELQRNKAPQFLSHLLDIQEFLKDKQTINVVFKNGDKVKVNASMDQIFYFKNNEIDLNISGNYKLKDLDKLVFNRSEFKIDVSKFYDLKKQIIKTPADMLSFKIDDMKEELSEEFNKYQKNFDYRMPSLIESCVARLKYIDEKNRKQELCNENDDKESYPSWYTEEFEKLWKQYSMIKILENASCIEDIKEVAVETGDNDLQKIYYILEGEELEDEEEESEEV